MHRISLLYITGSGMLQLQAYCTGTNGCVGDGGGNECQNGVLPCPEREKEGWGRGRQYVQQRQV